MIDQITIYIIKCKIVVLPGGENKWQVIGACNNIGIGIEHNLHVWSHLGVSFITTRHHIHARFHGIGAQIAKHGIIIFNFFQSGSFGTIGSSENFVILLVGDKHLLDGIGAIR
ncbi:Uncharacterised protein [Chlamydia trachomatis]|nr:Uncharacterised protein [Chlamydia trachomatis]